MKTFDIQVTYKTGKGEERTKLYRSVEALSESRAITTAHTLFRRDKRRWNSMITTTKVLKSTEIVPVEVAREECGKGTLPPQVEAMIGCPPTENPDPLVGDSVAVVRGSVQDRGMYVVRSSFHDADGNKRYVIERVGVPSPGRPRFWTLSRTMLRDLTTSPDTVEYKVLYPDDRVYTQGRANTYSSYGLDQLVQIKLTKRNGKIIKKEIV